MFCHTVPHDVFSMHSDASNVMASMIFSATTAQFGQPAQVLPTGRTREAVRPFPKYAAAVPGTAKLCDGTVKSDGPTTALRRQVRFRHMPPPTIPLGLVGPHARQCSQATDIAKTSPDNFKARQQTTNTDSSGQNATKANSSGRQTINARGQIIKAYWQTIKARRETA